MRTAIELGFGVRGACWIRTVALGHGASPALGARLVVIGGGISLLASVLTLTGSVR